MLQAINDKIKGCLGIGIVIVIGLTFSLWGIQSYLDDSGPLYAAKVNNTEISANEFERSVSSQRQKMLTQYGGELPIEEKALRELTLSQLINQRLLESVTFENGYRISDPVVAARITQLFTIDGVFDRARFENGVASAGMNIPTYEGLLRNELRVDQMQSGITNSVFVTKKELTELATLSEQTRNISVLTIDTEHFSTAAEPTGEEIKQFYDSNRQRYMVPEKIKVDYVEITSESLAKNVEIDEAQIQKMYDDYVASIAGREERKASHILLQTSDDKAAAKEKIEALMLDIENGADFAELAKKYSQDPGSAAEGGDLGWVVLGDMAKPFEQTLFDMELADKSKGAVSKVVETQFGFHLIKLEDIRSETVEPLGVKRYEFEDELKTETAASMFYDLSERLASIAYENPDSLHLVVEELGLEIMTSNNFTRVIGEGIFTNEKVRNIAFSPLVIAQGSNSDIIEISPTHVVVIRLNKHTPETAIPLEIVTPTIVKTLVVQNGYQQTKAAALEIKAKIEAGEKVESFESDGVSIEVISNLGRRDNAKVSSPSILKNAFEIVPGQNGGLSVGVVDLVTGDIALVVLTELNVPDEVAPDTLALVKSGIERKMANMDYVSVLNAMKNNATIDKNMRLLDK